jgi:hypothetical protein
VNDGQLCVVPQIKIESPGGNIAIWMANYQSTDNARVQLLTQQSLEQVLENVISWMKGKANAVAAFFSVMAAVR